LQLNNKDVKNSRCQNIRIIISKIAANLEKNAGLKMKTDRVYNHDIIYIC